MEFIPISDSNRFSLFAKQAGTPEYNALLEWREWFTGRGISAVIARTDRGYALYRNGLFYSSLEDAD